MICWCDELKDYKCSECTDIEYTSKLSVKDKIKLKAYDSILNSGTFDPSRKDHADLMSYIVNNNLKHERLHRRENE